MNPERRQELVPPLEVIVQRTLIFPCLADSRTRWTGTPNNSKHTLTRNLPGSTIVPSNCLPEGGRSLFHGTSDLWRNKGGYVKRGHIKGSGVDSFLTRVEVRSRLGLRVMSSLSHGHFNGSAVALTFLLICLTKYSQRTVSLPRF